MFSYSTTNEEILITLNEAVISFASDDLILELSDIYGRIVTQSNLVKFENIIKTEDLISGKYYCSIKRKGALLGTFVYTVVK